MGRVQVQVLFCVIFLVSSINCTPCKKVESLVITSGDRLQNGSIVHQGIEYTSAEWFEEEGDVVYGCPCIRRTCLWKCCHEGEAFNDSYTCNETEISEANFRPILYKGKEVLQLDAYEHFYYMPNNHLCDGRRYLVDPRNELYIQQNGTLYEVNEGNEQWHDPATFCVDMSLKSSIRMVAAVCFPLDEEVSADDSPALYMAPAIATEMANYGLLFVSNITKDQDFLIKSSQYVRKVLYIKLNSTENSTVSQQIVNVYSKATSQCPNLDVRLILKPLDVVNTTYPIDLILYDQTLSKEVEKLKDSVASLNRSHTVQSIGLQDSSSREESPSVPVNTYDYVVLGGTFDRLHNGHKILLSQAALRANKLLTVGVADVNLIQSKKLWELIEPVDKRVRSVLEFLNDVNPGIEYNVLPIQDMYGPTKDDPKFQLIVVSDETASYGDKVNEKRKDNGLPLLDKYVIDLVKDTYTQHSEEEEIKVSSTNLRMRLLGTMLKPPVPNPHIPEWPYVIGLTGGIASGKSTIANRLKEKGAAVLDYDLISHDLYKPGQPLTSKIADMFGKDVITRAGEVDRAKLGQIVFSNKNELEKLNQLVWPAVAEEASSRIKALGEQGYRVVVMEAAVMVRATWFTRCHQLWSVIIPPEEAVKRIQKTNSFTEEEARQRIASQPSNLEQVAHANIVFSPYWSYEHTQAQIDRAWDELQVYLKNRH